MNIKEELRQKQIQHDAILLKERQKEWRQRNLDKVKKERKALEGERIYDERVKALNKILQQIQIESSLDDIVEYVNSEGAYRNGEVNIATEVTKKLSFFESIRSGVKEKKEWVRPKETKSGQVIEGAKLLISHRPTLTGEIKDGKEEVYTFENWKDMVGWGDDYFKFIAQVYWVTLFSYSYSNGPTQLSGGGETHHGWGHQAEGFEVEVSERGVDIVQVNGVIDDGYLKFKHNGNPIHIEKSDATVQMVQGKLSEVFLGY